MIQREYYEVHIETANGNSFGDVFDFKPETKHLREAVQSTIASLRAEAANCGDDKIDGERSEIEAERLQDVLEFVDVLKPGHLDAAYGKTLEVMVAGVRIGDFEIETKLMLSKDPPDAYATPVIEIGCPHNSDLSGRFAGIGPGDAGV